MDKSMHALAKYAELKTTWPAQTHRRSAFLRNRPVIGVDDPALLI